MSAHQDPERITALAGLMDATKYCNTEQIALFRDMILAFYGPEAKGKKNGKRKTASKRSMENTSEKDN